VISAESHRRSHHERHRSRDRRSTTNRRTPWKVCEPILEPRSTTLMVAAGLSIYHLASGRCTTDASSALLYKIIHRVCSFFAD